MQLFCFGGQKENTVWLDNYIPPNLL